MKFISWNVNGLRAVHKKGFSDWFAAENADVVCLQEIKATRENIEDVEELLAPQGYHSVWHSAEKAGYSGLVIYSRKEPLTVREGLDIPEFDREARWLEADYDLRKFSPKAKAKLPDHAGHFRECTIINSYFPNSQRDHARLEYKLAFCAAAEARLEKLRAQGKMVLLCGDFNIAHKEIDLKNPKTNLQNAGFLPEERAWLEKMITQKGWLDAFRLFESRGDHYTWWSYRPGVREKNIGWRLDYFLVNPEARDLVKSASHANEVMGSDHCPVRLTLKV